MHRGFDDGVKVEANGLVSLQRPLGAPSLLQYERASLTRAGGCEAARFGIGHVAFTDAQVVQQAGYEEQLVIDGKTVSLT
jgi:hypothetical protein